MQIDKPKSELPLFLSTVSAERRDRRLALVAVIISVTIFAAVAPFARLPLLRVWGFIPAYELALIISDLITAIFLFAQLAILPVRGVLVLASGYLFTALIATAHMLTFPDLFAATGLLGAGPQSTAWLYMFWHAVFPITVIAYALTKDDGLAANSFRSIGPLFGAVQRCWSHCIGRDADTDGDRRAIVDAKHHARRSATRRR